MKTPILGKSLLQVIYYKNENYEIIFNIQKEYDSISNKEVGYQVCFESIEGKSNLDIYTEYFKEQLANEILSNESSYQEDLFEHLGNILNPNK